MNFFGPFLTPIMGGNKTWVGRNKFEFTEIEKRFSKKFNLIIFNGVE